FLAFEFALQPFFEMRRVPLELVGHFALEIQARTLGLALNLGRQSMRELGCELLSLVDMPAKFVVLPVVVAPLERPAAAMLPDGEYDNHQNYKAKHWLSLCVLGVLPDLLQSMERSQSMMPNMVTVGKASAMPTF